MQAISPVKSIAHFSPGKCIFQCLPSGNWKVRLNNHMHIFSLTKVHGRMQFLGAAKAGLVGASIRTLLSLEATRQSRLPQSGGGVLEFSWDHACGAFQLIMPCGVLRDDALLRLPQLPRLPCSFGLLDFHGWVRLGDGVPKVHGMLHRHLNKAIRQRATKMWQIVMIMWMMSFMIFYNEFHVWSSVFYSASLQGLLNE